MFQFSNDICDFSNNEKLGNIYKIIFNFDVANNYNIVKEVCNIKSIGRENLYYKED